MMTVDGESMGFPAAIMYHRYMSSIRVEAARQVRDHFAEVIDRSEPTIVARHGRQVAAIIPIDDFRRFEELENLELHRLLEQRRGELGQPGFSLDEVLQETLTRNE